VKTKLEAKEVISGISAFYRRIKLKAVLDVITYGIICTFLAPHAKSPEALGEASTLLFVLFSLPGPAVLPVASRDLSLETADPRES